MQFFKKIIFASLIICVFSQSYAESNDDKSKLTIGTPNETAEFAIGVCLGSLNNLDRIRMIAKDRNWKPIPKEQLFMYVGNPELIVEGWLAINNNHPYILLINEGPGTWRNNKFIENAKSNVCTIVDIYSDRNEVLSSLKKSLEMTQVFYDPGKTLPLELIDAFRINNAYHSDETYLVVISAKDLEPPIMLTFMSEHPETKLENKK